MTRIGEGERVAIVEKRALKITDIAEMIYLADGVLQATRYPSLYNENGVRLPRYAVDEQFKKDRASGQGELVETFLHSVHDLTAAIEITPEEISEKLLPLKNRILGMFRNGEVNTEAYMYDELYADNSVPDEWLLQLFAMRVRDKIISFVLQEMAAKEATEKGDK